MCLPQTAADLGIPNESRLQGLGIRGSGWKAGAAKSKKALGALLPIVPKELQRRYWQSSLVPFGRNQGRLSAVMAVKVASPARALPTMVRAGGAAARRRGAELLLKLALNREED